MTTATVTLDQLKAEARALERRHPGGVSSERTVTHVLIAEPTATTLHTACLLVKACYSDKWERISSLSGRVLRYGAGGPVLRPPFKNYAYILQDMRRQPWEQEVRLSESAARDVLAGIYPPPLPVPALMEGEPVDPFEGIVDKRLPREVPLR